MAGTGTPPRPGRPRDPRTDESILVATRELLAEQGYNRVSIEAVARRAGVTRPTVYRRWPSKAHLVHEAVYPAREMHFAPHPDEAFAAGVLRFAHAALDSFRRPETAAAVPGLLAEYRDQPELKELLVARMDPVRAIFRAFVEEAAARGEARADLDADLLFESLSGALMFGVLGSDLADNPGFAASVAELITRGAARS
ncbi:TetR/AcrR family transcriptional regulator [Streptomyces sp. SID3343]|uniref:TetR/AcrR family transcriptional regulator n=1 Tax=Streptomyces sp. SID3343 TaxID=2690260 RepID=UPI001368473D|nr:TetR/AcrR family transcriptional regulator [Streptomyces sp. SID3343]MYW02353.1 TetR family transcriptional regulator [Streptomyces sp. SID3343]